MERFYRRAWLEISLDRLAENIGVLRSKIGEGCEILAVIKADAYGHGAAVLAPALESLGVRRFGVASASEGAALRDAGVTGDILVLSYSEPSLVPFLIEQQLTQAMTGPQHAAALSEAAARLGAPLSVQLKLDTGMTRAGFCCRTGQQLDEAAAACRLPQLHLTGVFSHLSSADDGSAGADEYTLMQIDRYRAALDGLTRRGVEVGLCHLANSGGAQKYPQAQFDLVRCGAILCGYQTATDVPSWPIRPIAALKTAVSCVREVRPQTAISYSRTFVSQHPMKIATLPIGYADGYPRALSNCGRVMIRGQWAAVVGNVCMDQMMVDVTDIPGVVEGDTAVIIGEDGALSQTADDLAAAAGSCMHEILTRFGPRLQRLYYKDGALIDIR